MRDSPDADQGRPVRRLQPDDVHVQRQGRPVRAQAGRARLSVGGAAADARQRDELLLEHRRRLHRREQPRAAEDRRRRRRHHAGRDQHGVRRGRPVRRRDAREAAETRERLRRDARPLRRAERPVPRAAAARPEHRARHGGPRRRLRGQPAYLCTARRRELGPVRAEPREHAREPARRGRRARGSRDRQVFVRAQRVPAAPPGTDRRRHGRAVEPAGLRQRGAAAELRDAGRGRRGARERRGIGAGRRFRAHGGVRCGAGRGRARIGRGAESEQRDERARSAGRAAVAGRHPFPEHPAALTRHLHRLQPETILTAAGANLRRRRRFQVWHRLIQAGHTYEETVPDPRPCRAVLVRRGRRSRGSRSIESAGAHQVRDAAGARRSAHADDQAGRYRPHHDDRQQGHPAVHRFPPHDAARDGPQLAHRDACPAAAGDRAVQATADPHLLGRARATEAGPADPVSAVSRGRRRHRRRRAHGRDEQRPAGADRLPPVQDGAGLARLRPERAGCLADPDLPAAVQREDPAKRRGGADPVPDRTQPAACLGQAGIVSRFDSGATLTHASAKAALAQGLARIEAGATAVDCGALAQFDSSALAVLLAWQRAARARGVTLDIENLPPKLASLAQAYGIDTLLSGRH
ncbi:hypothetical protein BURPS1710b_3700 [Burkholderia pseudomallei 1710b]|uniref:STAS domain-containing protein n=1 Tax=Burkholderia pseudomallei (strain 1710b) TaxID=320372 RepID=Q3JMZ0_BURP1|nr:hypothetical protein BURPS1710b_3700 [Burkholderia pseudomallei 1710b]